MLTRNLAFVKRFIDENTDKESTALDLTTGNGNDTLYLAQRTKMVFGFDIQEKAIRNTTNLLKNNNVTNYKLYLDSHSNVDKYTEIHNIDFAIFNLGYLPNGNKEITTVTDSTIESISKVLSVLNKDGNVVIVLYPGHNNGKEEAKEVENYVSSLDSRYFEVLKYQFINKVTPPYILIVNKK